jgi:hypothetical protein
MNKTLKGVVPEGHIYIRGNVLENRGYHTRYDSMGKRTKPAKRC